MSAPEPACHQCGALTRATTLYQTHDGWLCVNCCIQFVIGEAPDATEQFMRTHQAFDDADRAEDA